jgi:hypothetical protein
MSTMKAVVPSDTVPLETITDRLYIGVAGDLAVIAMGDTVPVTLAGAPVGFMHLPRYITQVMATNTTATNIVSFKTSAP